MQDLTILFTEMYENYLNGNREDHRKTFFLLSNINKLEYLLYIFSVSGKEYPRILESLKS